MSPSVLKKLAGLTAILVVLWVAYLYRQVPHERVPFKTAASSAEQILLEQGPQKMQLSKSGGDWQVVDSGLRRPADEEKVKALLSGLKNLQLEDEISNRADRHPEYQVDEASGTHVSLQNSQGRVLAEGILGKQAPDFAHSYFRFPNQPNVYLARGVLPGDVGTPAASAWRRRDLIRMGESNIQAILIERQGLKTDLVRTSTDTWTLNGKALPPGSIDRLVGTLAHLQASEFVDERSASNLSFEALTFARVTVKGPNASVELRIGAPDKKLKRYPVSTGKDAGLAWVSDAAIDAILRKPF